MNGDLFSQLLLKHPNIQIPSFLLPKLYGFPQFLHLNSIGLTSNFHSSPFFFRLIRLSIFSSNVIPLFHTSSEHDSLPFVLPLNKNEKGETKTIFIKFL